MMQLPFSGPKALFGKQKKSIINRYSRLTIKQAVVIATSVSAGFLILTILASFVFRPYNSDDVAVQRVMQTMLPIDHNQSIVGTDNFLIHTPLYFLVDLALPNSSLKLLIVNLILNAIFFAGIILLTLVLCRPYIKSKLQVWLAYTPIIWFFSLASGDFVPNRVDRSLTTSTAFMNPNYRTAEIGILLLTIAGIIYFFPRVKVFTKKILSSTKATILSGAILFTLFAIFFFSDPFFIYTVGLGIIATVWLGWLKGRVSLTTAFYTSSIVLLSASVGKGAISRIATSIGIIPIDNVEKLFAPFPSLVTNITNSLWSHFILFHADFWGHFLSQGKTIVFLTNALLLILSIAALLYIIIRLHKNYRHIIAFLLFAILASLAAFTVTAHGTHIENYRYLFMNSVLMIILLSYSLSQISLSKKTSKYLAVLGIIFITSLTLNTLINLKMVASAIRTNGSAHQHPLNREQQDIINILQQKKITKGYGDYWDANIITYLSQNQISMLPLSCTDYQFKQYHWFVNTSDYKKEAHNTYFLANSDDVSNIIRSCSPIKHFGQPKESIPLGSRYTILIYDKDIGKELPIYLPLARTSF